jgi:ABC-type Zn uptake system ZnuABC Zn-binding protein ZnuA/ABC-type Mn2+/Zn2+ transport system permease subunit
LLDPFQLPFVQRGLIEVLILAIPAGLLGTWIVLRGLAFFSHAVGTAAFPGLVLADGLGFAAPLGAFGAAVAFTAGAAVLARRRPGDQDSLTAMVLVGCLATGVILASDVFRSGSNVETLLFGSLLLIDGQDIGLAAAAAAATLAATFLFGRRWLAAGFDPTVARSVGASGRYLQAALLALVALATTAALSVIGALLVAALFVVPAATVRLLTARMLTWQIGSVALAALEGTVGLWLSVKTDAPPGATIATLSGAVFALATVARALPRPGRRARLAAAVAALSLLAAGCSSSGSSDSGGLEVVATTTQVGDFVREVGGDAVDVDQILQPNTDPHEYEPRPSDIEGAAGAELVFASGDELDGWIDQVVSESGSDARIVDLGAAVPVKLPGETSGAEASEYDPHWWHDPRNAEDAVEEIRRSLAEAEPSKAAEFRRNADAYLDELRRLDRGIARCVNSVPAAQRKLVTDHDALGYYAKRYGITVVGAVIPSQTTQAQPSAKDVSDLVELIEREGVKAVFAESGVSPKLAETIAQQTGASSDYTLYSDTLGPEDSSGGTYLQMEAANTDAIVRGFTGDRRGCHIQGTG